MHRIARITTALLIPGIIIAIELVVRAMELVSFPVYKIENGVEYIPIQSQDGNFMNMNDWYFNNISMPISDNWNKDGFMNTVLSAIQS